MTEESNHEQAQKRLVTRQVLSELVENTDVKMQPGAEKHHTKAESETQPTNVDLLFLTRLASASPAPAGGSAAAYSGAMAAALISMVANITTSNPKYTSAHKQMQEILQFSESLRIIFTRSVDKDGCAYQKYLESRRQPAITPEEILEKDALLRSTSQEIIRLPLELGEKCLDLLNLSLTCVELGTFSTICDSRTAGLLAETAMRVCIQNVLFNLRESPDETFNAATRKSIRFLADKLSGLKNQIEEQFSIRSGFIGI